MTESIKKDGNIALDEYKKLITTQMGLSISSRYNDSSYFVEVPQDIVNQIGDINTIQQSIIANVNFHINRFLKFNGQFLIQPNFQIHD